jgi:uncharacterized protein (TIGR02246 family)
MSVTSDLSEPPNTAPFGVASRRAPRIQCGTSTRPPSERRANHKPLGIRPNDPFQEKIVKILRAIVLSLGSLLASSAALSAASQSADERNIRELVARWQESWNTHDMKAMAALLAEDADFVNVAGLHWKGKTQIEAEHAARHRTNLKNSIWETHNITVQALSQNFALVHIDWGISGDTDFDGTPRQPREGIFSWLVSKRDGRWLIRAVQNTNNSPRK